MGLYLRMAWRNIWRHRRRTLIIILAIGISMWMMMLYDGLITGFQDAIYGNAIRVFGGNLQVHAQGYNDEIGQNPLLPIPDVDSVMTAVKAQPNVVSATRRITTSGLASNSEGSFAVSITGVEPASEQGVSLIAKNVTEGRYLTGDDQDSILIGKGLALQMGLQVGDRMTLIGHAAGGQMRRHTLTVTGVYDLGIRDIEKRTVYISLAEAQYLYNLDGQVTEIAINLQKLGQEPATLAALRPQMPNVELDTWEDSYPELNSAMSTKNGVMDVFSAIIVIIAAIGILNMLLMAVYERRREIGLMGALGMRPRQVSVVFLLEGTLVGLVGVVFGLLLGIGMNLLLGQVGFDYTQFASLTSYTALISGRVYPTLGLEKMAQRVITVLVISILAAFYPAREAARREPAEMLHSV